MKKYMKIRCREPSKTAIMGRRQEAAGPTPAANVWAGDRAWAQHTILPAKQSGQWAVGHASKGNPRELSCASTFPVNTGVHAAGVVENTAKTFSILYLVYWRGKGMGGRGEEKETILLDTCLQVAPFCPLLQDLDSASFQVTPINGCCVAEL